MVIRAGFNILVKRSARCMPESGSTSCHRRANLPVVGVGAPIWSGMAERIDPPFRRFTAIFHP